MALIFKNGSIEIWAINEAWGTDYYVYGLTASGDPRVCVGRHGMGDCSMRDLLINQSTGQLDWPYINRIALARADGEFGGPGAPNSYVRSAIRYYQDLALVMRRRWLADQGLPDDQPMTMVAVATWGASGDSFGSAR